MCTLKWMFYRNHQVHCCQMAVLYNICHGKFEQKYLCLLVINKIRVFLLLLNELFSYCMCLSEPILFRSTICRLEFGTGPTVWHFLFVLLVFITLLLTSSNTIYEWDKRILFTSLSFFVLKGPWFNSDCTIWRTFLSNINRKTNTSWWPIDKGLEALHRWHWFSLRYPLQMWRFTDTYRSPEGTICQFIITIRVLLLK